MLKRATMTVGLILGAMVGHLFAVECESVTPGFDECVTLNFDLDCVGPFAYVSVVGPTLWGVTMSGGVPSMIEVVAKLDPSTDKWVYDYQGKSGESVAFTVYGVEGDQPPGPLTARLRGMAARKRQLLQRTIEELAR